MPTRPRQYRLTEETTEQIREIAAHYGLPSEAAAVRYAVGRLHAATFGDPADVARNQREGGRGKSPKKSA